MMLQFRLMKHYFIASALVFITGIVLGMGFSDQFQSFIETQMKGLEQLSQSINDKPNPQWSLFWIIFWNNVSKSILIIGLGVFFGVLPLFFLLSNGLLLGYVMAVSSEKQSILYVIKAILPHGIIEIPAVIFACAFGLRLGILVLKSFGALTSATRSAKFKEDFRGFAKALVPVFIIIVVTLTAAALIESTFTYWLVQPQ
ncbi:stage II sporulation protein M [Paenibacillus sp. RC67]|uniref:stage II sporulation protein M n=1 Tax=Paenibacillus sp. RC67 TaxID=3039392 RepID=UPI0024ADC8B2|nr:stage II sporulation protein M [Paenibacillus sp. RC67]